MKYSAIIIDVSNLYHAAYYYRDDEPAILPNGTKIVASSIALLIKMVEKIRKEYLSRLSTEARRCKVYLLFDNCQSKARVRKQIDPNYKKNRTKKIDEFYNSLDYFHLIALSFHDSWATVKVEGYEADDLVKPLIENLKADNHKNILLVSKDWDWARYIDKDIWWKHGDKLDNAESLQEELGFYPTEESITLYKMIRGDSEDNIPAGVPRFPSVSIQKMVKHVSELAQNRLLIDRMYEYVNSSDLSDKWKKEFSQAESRLKLNEQLIRSIPLDKKEIIPYISQGKYRPKSLEVLYKNIGVNIEDVDRRLFALMAAKNPDDSIFKSWKLDWT